MLWLILIGVLYHFSTDDEGLSQDAKDILNVGMIISGLIFILRFIALGFWI